MADDAIKEMIAAYALGCMDKENFKQFKNYLKKNGKLPEGELGDLQNIVALIPTILDIESPREELKNELGKKLIQIQKDINNNIIEDRRNTRIVATKEFIKRDVATKVFDVGQNRKPLPSPPIKREEKRETKKEKQNPTRMNTIIEPHTKRKKNYGTVAMWFLLILLAVALVFVYITLNNKISDLKTKTSMLEIKVTKLRSDISSTNEFIKQNTDFVEFFNNPYIDFVPLKGIDKSSKASGRLFLSFGTGEGLLQVRNMPRLDPEKIFQLWIVTKSGTFSLGTFEVKPDKRYIFLSEIPFVMKDEIEMFRVTKEKKDGAITPTGETIIFGSFVKPKSKKRKRRR